jgi:hypothetical protein
LVHCWGCYFLPDHGVLRIFRICAVRPARFYTSCGESPATIQRQLADPNNETRVDRLLRQMTLEEKIGHLVQYNDTGDTPLAATPSPKPAAAKAGCDCSREPGDGSSCERDPTGCHWPTWIDAQHYRRSTNEDPNKK